MLPLYFKEFSAVVLAMAFCASALGQETLNADGLIEKPRCDLDFLIKNTLKGKHGIVPSGEKASTREWDMEVLYNPQNLLHVVVGRSKNPKADPEELCVLVEGIGPYKQSTWYQVNKFSMTSDSPPK